MTEARLPSIEAQPRSKDGGVTHNTQMGDFHSAWTLSRGRYLDEISGLTAAGLNFRLYPGSLSIGEAALHVAGTEARLAAEIDGLALDPFLERVREAASDGIVNDAPYPFEEITPELVSLALEASRDFGTHPARSDASSACRCLHYDSGTGDRW